MKKKKKFIVGVTIGLLIFGAGFIFLKKSNTVTNHPSNGSTIVAFGDSLTKGTGATGGNDMVSLLSARIGEPIVNLGIPGNTSRQGLERIQSVIDQKPKVVMVLFGGNDFLQKVPIDETFKNIEEIVSKIQDSGAVVVLLGIRGGTFSDPYKKRFEDIAERKGTLYVENVLSGIITDRSLMSDAIHPNDKGYEKIANKIYPILKKAL